MKPAYAALAAAQEQLDLAMSYIASTGGDPEPMKLASACMTEGMEHLIYAASQQLEREGVSFECPICARRWPLQHGDRCQDHPDTPGLIHR